MNEEIISFNPDEENATIKDDVNVKNPVVLNFAYWEVDGINYKLKLKTSTIAELENKFKTGLMNKLGSESGMPPLATMLVITHAAMKEWQHGITINQIYTLFDKYIENGGSQLDFYKSVYMKIFTVSGFFPQKMAVDLNAAMDAPLEV